MNTTRTVRIRVGGRLSRRLAAVFEGMTLVDCGDGSELVGEVSDQAQLHGLLGRIRDLGIELESLDISASRAVSEGAAETRRAPFPESTP